MKHTKLPAVFSSLIIQVGVLISNPPLGYNVGSQLLPTCTCRTNLEGNVLYVSKQDQTPPPSTHSLRPIF